MNVDFRNWGVWTLPFVVMLSLSSFLLNTDENCSFNMLVLALLSEWGIPDVWSLRGATPVLSQCLLLIKPQNRLGVGIFLTANDAIYVLCFVCFLTCLFCHILDLSVSGMVFWIIGLSSFVVTMLSVSLLLLSMTGWSYGSWIYTTTCAISAYHH